MNLGSHLPFSGCFGRLVSPSAVAITNDETPELHTKLMAALKKKKEEFRNKFKQEMSFTRVLLKLGTVRTFIHDIRRVFEARDTDSSGRIDMCEMSAAMKDLEVNLSEDEVKTLFKMADFYEDKQLTMKQFLVVLAIGYVLDAIPDLRETKQTAEAEAAARAAGRRLSNFYNKERTVRDALGLFTYAYLLFDKDCKGVISREQVMVVVAENGQKDVGSMNILSQERWDEMDWDSNGDISFGEFVYAFTKWVDVDGEETAEDLETQKEAEADLSREGGQARRKSSGETGRRTSGIAKEITRRISSALSPSSVAQDSGGSGGDGGSNGQRSSSLKSSPAREAAAAPATSETPERFGETAGLGAAVEHRKGPRGAEKGDCSSGGGGGGSDTKVMTGPSDRMTTATGGVKRRAPAAPAARKAATEDARSAAEAPAVTVSPSAADRKKAAAKVRKAKRAKALKERKRLEREAAAKAAGCAADGAGSKDEAVMTGGVSKIWPMFSAFLYFLAVAVTMPAMPRVVNGIVTGSTGVTAASATVYGLLSHTDPILALLTVKFQASLSDKYGRKPFLALSVLGLGTGFYMIFHGRRVWALIAAVATKGFTSCMHSTAQACITDCVGTGAGLGEAFGMFQGLSLGMAFTIGLPTGGVLGAKYGARFPLLVSVGLCLANFVMIALIMPETLPQEKRAKQVDLKQANPLGAVLLATRNKLITGVIACWTLLWIAHVGLQINWINYSDLKFGWNSAQSGASLTLMGLLGTVFPKIIIPRLGLERSITYGLLTYTVGQLVIASAPGMTTKHGQYGTPLVVSGLVLASAGTIVFPSMLAYLCNQVGSGEVGALLGTTDMVKTVCSVLCGPAMAWIFGYFISEKAYPRQIEGASYYVGAAVALLAWMTARRTFAVYGALDRFPPSARAKR
eukprot:g10443.t1